MKEIPKNLLYVEEVVHQPMSNAFDFIFKSIQLVGEHLGITTSFIVSSEIPIDHQNLKGQEKVLALCQHFKAERYLNPIGGVGLYQTSDFEKQGTQLQFLKANLKPYSQLLTSQYQTEKEVEFVSGLSILDVLMFNGREGTKELLNNFTLETFDSKGL